MAAEEKHSSLKFVGGLRLFDPSYYSEETDQSSAAPQRLKSVTSNKFAFAKLITNSILHLLTASLEFLVLVLFGQTPQTKPILRQIEGGDYFLTYSFFFLKSPLSCESHMSRGERLCQRSAASTGLSSVLCEILHK